MKLPTIGELRHRVRIEAETRDDDGGGGADATWSLVAEAWASIKATGGTEAAAADALRGRTTHEIWIRYRDDVIPAMRFVASARIFDVRAVLDPDGRGRWLRCLVQERAG